MNRFPTKSGFPPQVCMILLLTNPTLTRGLSIKQRNPCNIGGSFWLPLQSIHFAGYPQNKARHCFYGTTSHPRLPHRSVGLKEGSLFLRRSSRSQVKLQHRSWRAQGERSARTATHSRLRVSLSPPFPGFFRMLPTRVLQAPSGQPPI